LYPPYMSTVCSSCNRYGKDDELGTLNRLTNDVVLEAAKEIKTGTRQVFMPSFVSSALTPAPRISLNWALDAQPTPFFGRQVCSPPKLLKTLYNDLTILQGFEKKVYQKPPRCTLS